MNGFLSRLLPATMFLLMLGPPTSAETIAETAKQWGLIGPWSLDCALPLDHAKGDGPPTNSMAYHLIDRRDIGDSR